MFVEFVNLGRKLLKKIMFEYYLQVVEKEDDELVEILSEDDGILLFFILVVQFLGVCGLKYRNF